VKANEDYICRGCTSQKKSSESGAGDAESIAMDVENV